MTRTVGQLRDQGHLTVKPGKHRSIEIVEGGE